ncbi:hypothetical protein ATY76_22340 [Rhizobium sp. R339]|nr:hypothetical protein ATY76_22340 [Rhizobium sp. R339]
MTAKQRIARFAQADHMRLFGTEDTVQVMTEVFGAVDVTFSISKHLTRDLAEAFGVESAYLADREGKLCGSTVFYFENK